MVNSCFSFDTWASLARSASLLTFLVNQEPKWQKPRFQLFGIVMSSVVS